MDYTEPLVAGLQVGMILFGSVWAVRLLLELILRGGGRD